MSRTKRQREGRMPRVLTPEQIAKLSDHGLLAYRKTVLDRKEGLERRFLTDEAHEAARMPDGSDRLRGLDQRDGRQAVKDITGNDDLSKHKTLTYLAWETGREIAQRSGLASESHQAHVDDPDTITCTLPRRGLDWHRPLRPQREGHRKGRRRGHR